MSRAAFGNIESKCFRDDPRLDAGEAHGTETHAKGKDPILRSRGRCGRRFLRPRRVGVVSPSAPSIGRLKGKNPNEANEQVLFDPRVGQKLTLSRPSAWRWPLPRRVRSGAGSGRVSVTPRAWTRRSLFTADEAVGFTEQQDHLRGVPAFNAEVRVLFSPIG